MNARFALQKGTIVHQQPISPCRCKWGLRDLHAAVQHGAVQQQHYVSVGRLILNGSSGLMDGRS